RYRRYRPRRKWAWDPAEKVARLAKLAGRGRQDHRRPGRLAEVEVTGQASQDGDVFAHGRPRIGAAVGQRVQPLATQEDVLDELDISVEAEGLVVDVVLLRIGADDQRWDPQAVAVLVHHRRHHVIVEAAPVIPGQEDGGAVPVRSLHGGIDQAGHPGLPLAHLGGRMLAVGTAGRDPGNGRQVAIHGGVDVDRDTG